MIIALLVVSFLRSSVSAQGSTATRFAAMSAGRPFFATFFFLKLPVVVGLSLFFCVSLLTSSTLRIFIAGAMLRPFF